MTSVLRLPAGSDADVDDAVRTELANAQTQLAAYRAAFDAISVVCGAAAEGDLEPRVADLGDDAALIAVRRGLNHMLDLTDAFVREASASLEHASGGRFFRRFLVRGMHGSFRAAATVINDATDTMRAADARLREAESEQLRLADEFESAVLSVAQHVAAASTELEASSRSLANTAEHTAARASDAVSGSEEASNGVASVAAAVEELASTVGEIERQAGESNDASKRAAREADLARDTMRVLADAAREIRQVATVINTVASQTRLLALNATIEAARAGAAGKGFAVVAAEVKQLAAQTGEATGLIEAQVDQIQQVTTQAVAAIDGVAQTIRGMSDGADQIAHAVGEQRVATQEMSRNTHAVAGATENVTRNVTEVTHGTTETSAAAVEITAAATDLSRLAETLHAEVDGFLRHIRGT
jgi:methyl-accepting chemotaxis protein